jgi:hypothetical protein
VSSPAEVEAQARWQVLVVQVRTWHVPQARLKCHCTRHECCSSYGTQYHDGTPCSGLSLPKACVAVCSRKPRIALGSKWLLHRQKEACCPWKCNCEHTSASTRAKRKVIGLIRLKTEASGGDMDTHSTPEGRETVVPEFDLGR